MDSIRHLAPRQLRTLLHYAEQQKVDPGVCQRLQWFMAAATNGFSVREVAERFRVAQATVRRWLKRFDPADLSTLTEHSRRPHHLRRPDTEERVIGLIRAYRKKFPTMGQEKIQKKLHEQYGIDISVSTIWRIISRHQFYFADTITHRERRAQGGSHGVFSLFLLISLTLLSCILGVERASAVSIANDSDNGETMRSQNFLLQSEGGGNETPPSPPPSPPTPPSLPPSLNTAPIGTQDASGGGWRGGYSTTAAVVSPKNTTRPAAPLQQQKQKNQTPPIPHKSPLLPKPVLKKHMENTLPAVPPAPVKKNGEKLGAAPAPAKLQFFDSVDTLCPPPPACPVRSCAQARPPQASLLSGLQSIPSTQVQSFGWISLVCLWVLTVFYWCRRGRSIRKKGKCRWTLLSLLGALAFALEIPGIAADSPLNIQQAYHGQLLDSSGTPLTTPHQIRISLWTSADYVSSDITATGDLHTSAPNYAGWSEIKTVVPDTTGNFVTIMGAGTSLPKMDSLSPEDLSRRYIQIEIKAASAASTAWELLDANASNALIDRSPIFRFGFMRTSGGLHEGRVGTGSGSLPFLGSGGMLPMHMMPEGSMRPLFTIGNGTTHGEIALQFGQILGKRLSFDVLADRFNFNDDVRIQGNLTVTGLINGVNITASGTAVTLRYHAAFEHAAFQGDATNNVGQLSIDHDAISLRNFYRWTSSLTSLQDYDVILRATLPLGFVRWKDNPLAVTYRSTIADTAKNKLDISVFDTNGSPVTLSGSATGLTSTSWATTQIEFTGSPTWTAGQDFLVKFKLSSKDGAQVHLGDVQHSVETH